MFSEEYELPVALVGREDPELQHPSRGAWVAVEPPVSPLTANYNDTGRDESDQTPNPPSFTASQFGTILRRQRLRPLDNSGLKDYPALPSRFVHLTNSFEFAGWGSVARLRLSSEDLSEGDSRIQRIRKARVLGQFTASGLAGTAVLGSVFYSIPAVVAVAGVYSPISLFIATLILYLWRPIIEELASALPISGAPYTYLLQVSTKTLALVGASLLLLDFASTAIVSAAIAATYLAGEVPALPFPTWAGAIMVLAIFTVISLLGVRESARVAFGLLFFHLLSMAVLIIAASVAWGKAGSSQLRENWKTGTSGHTSPSAVAKQIFFGICLGVLGLTGFECAPSYVSRIKPGRFVMVLRNVHIPAIILNTVLMLLVLGLIPLDVILGGANVLSILAEVSGGHALRIFIVIDAVVVLCGGVLAGILSACELLEQLALHRVVPSVFLWLVPRTGSPYVSVLTFVVFVGMLYATASASLAIISEMFSLVWLTVMGLFPISLLLLKFNRGRLRREGKKTSLATILLALFLVPVIFAGNVAYQPVTVGYFAAYVIGIVVFFSASQNKIHILRWIYWIYDQYPLLHRWSITKSWGASLIRLMNTLRRRPVCILAKTDEINGLFQMISYVRHNEETSYLKIVHFYEEEKGIPSELEANAKILDEAFPEITVDLLLVEATFDPPSVAALSNSLGIPQSLMFMSCPGEDFKYSMAELGTRIISF
ncbi:AAAP amino acid permease [Crepidotus variabilis]|uniref:AAAP amino acid permease n=1 Tax=Crepidotus variabilis TaxID=179855 RepID=A0A9P6ELI4_9AGAR|nr:AAAP amino acid permease [Crepidotus variabilis]